MPIDACRYLANLVRPLRRIRSEQVMTEDDCDDDDDLLPEGGPSLPYPGDCDIKLILTQIREAGRFHEITKLSYRHKFNSQDKVTGEVDDSDHWQETHFDVEFRQGAQ